VRALLLGVLLLLGRAQSDTGRVEVSIRDATARERIGISDVAVTLTFKFPSEPAGFIWLAPSWRMEAQYVGNNRKTQKQKTLVLT
jgi:hypothetical protein